MPPTDIFSTQICPLAAHSYVTIKASWYVVTWHAIMTSTLLKLITLSTFLGKSTVLLFLNVVKYIVFISLSCIKWRCIDGVIPSKAFAPTTSYFPFNHSMFVHSVSKPHNVECQAGGQFHLTLPSAGLTQVKLLPVYRGVIFQRGSEEQSWCVLAQILSHKHIWNSQKIQLQSGNVKLLKVWALSKRDPSSLWATCAISCLEPYDAKPPVEPYSAIFVVPYIVP